MEKKTAEEILGNHFLAFGDDDLQLAITLYPSVDGIIAAMEEYSSLQSEEKDKKIDNLQRIIKEEREIRQRHEVTLSKMLAKQRDEIERLREAVSTELQIIKNLIAGKRVVNLDEAIAYYESLLSNQPIESDKIMKEEKQNGYAPINITQAEEIQAKDRRIKELEEKSSRLIADLDGVFIGALASQSKKVLSDALV